MNEMTNKRASWWRYVFKEKSAASYGFIEPHFDDRNVTTIHAADADDVPVRIAPTLTRVPESGTIISALDQHALRISHALNRLFEQKQQDAATAAKAGDDPSFRTLSSLFPDIDDNPEFDEVILRNDKVELSIMQTKIALLPIAGDDGHADTRGYGVRW